MEAPSTDSSPALRLGAPQREGLVGQLRLRLLELQRLVSQLGLNLLQLLPRRLRPHWLLPLLRRASARAPAGEGAGNSSGRAGGWRGEEAELRLSGGWGRNAVAGGIFGQNF